VACRWLASALFVVVVLSMNRAALIVLDPGAW